MYERNYVALENAEKSRVWCVFNICRRTSFWWNTTCQFCF